MNQPSSAPTPEDHQAASGLMARLRAETDIAHRRLEERLDVTSRLSERIRYVGLLQIFYGIYQPFEHLLEQRFGPEIAGMELASRCKSPWIVEDLRLLDADTRHEDASMYLPDLRTEAEALGVLYVLEGSTLGGQMISRMVERDLGIGPQNGARFFHGYGSETGIRWRAFGKALEAAQPDPVNLLSAANATFTAFERWAGHCLQLGL